MTTKEDPIVSLSKSTMGKKNDLLHFNIYKIINLIKNILTFFNFN